MSYRGITSGRGSNFPGGRPTGQQYAAFHTALLARCYPNRERMSTGQPVIVSTPRGSKTAGHIRKMGQVSVFVMTGAAATLHRNLDGYGVDVRVLNELDRRDIRRIRVVADDGAIYDTTINVYRAHGIDRDYGFGRQLFLSRNWWFKHEC